MTRALRIVHIAWIALAVACSNCSNANLTLPEEPIAVDGGRFQLAIADRGSSIALMRDQTTLVSLDASAFQLGVVEGATALDPTRSWDPIEIDRRGEADSGVVFRSPRSFSAIVTSTDSHDAEIDVDYGDGITAKISITLAAQDQGARFIMTLAADDTPVGGPVVALARVRVHTNGDDLTEGFYGLGEQLDSVDNRGKLRAMQLEADAAIESGNNDAHVPVPFLVGTRGWAMFVASTRVGAFDVARKDPHVIETTFAVAAPTGTRAEALRVDLMAADIPLDLYREYFTASGIPRPPPLWSLGPWIWRNENKDEAEVEDDIAQIRDLDLATSGIWIDRPYATAVNTFDFDKTRYPDPQSMINRAIDAGLHVALWSTPYLEDAAQPMKTEATTRGFFPKQVGVLLNTWSAPIDFTSPDAAAYWRGLVQRYTAMGVDGFKLDYAEDVVPSIAGSRNVWSFSDGSDERTMHHRYSGLYHRVYSDAASGREPAAQSSPNVGLPFMLVRAAHWGEQTQGVIVWPGDMDATFTHYGDHFTTSAAGQDVVAGVGGLPATVVMGLSLSASGFPFFAADTGGFRHSPPDKELWIRWVEQTALSTVMEVGDGSSTPPWVFTQDNGRDEEALDIYRTYARLHMRLFPYEWTYAQRLGVDGRPIQRPLGLAYPELGVHPNDEYMFGDDLLVAPIVDRGSTHRRLIAPHGTWIDFWDATPYTPDQAGNIDVDAPLGKLPLFLREGAILPMLRPTIDTLAAATDDNVDSFAKDAGPLWALIAPEGGGGSAPTEFDLWDGARIARLGDGSFALRDGVAFDRGFVLQIIATSSPNEVVRDDGLVPHVQSLDLLDQTTKGWTWTSERRGTLFIKLPPSLATTAGTPNDTRVTIR